MEILWSSPKLNQNHDGFHTIPVSSDCLSYINNIFIYSLPAAKVESFKELADQNSKKNFAKLINKYIKLRKKLIYAH